MVPACQFAAGVYDKRMIPRLFILTLVVTGPLLPGSMLPESPIPQQVASGYVSLEGPTWDVASQTLYFSDQSGNAMGIYTWNATEGKNTFRGYSKKVNGNAFDLQGRLVTCESGNRSLVRFTRDGEREVLVSSHLGQPLNEPNDVVVKSDGTIWFTTPTWSGQASEKSRMYVLRHDPSTGETVEVFLDANVRPNGLAFSPDEKTFYLNNNSGNQVLAFEVEPDNTLSHRRVLVSGLASDLDGLTVDAYGNLVIAVWGGKDKGVVICDPQGNILQKIPMTANTTNVEFGGPDLRTLFITSGGALYQLKFPPVEFPAPAPPARVTTLSSTEGIEVHWDDLADNELGFLIERTDDQGVFQTLARAHQANTSTHLDASGKAGQTYAYRVSAYNGAGTSTAVTSTMIVAGCDFYEGSEMGDGIRSTGWIGEVLTAGPWVYSVPQGWWYVATLGPGSFFALDSDPRLTWVWTGRNIYPFLFSFAQDAWLWFYDRDDEGKRWFLKFSGASNDWLIL